MSAPPDPVSAPPRAGPSGAAGESARPGPVREPGEEAPPREAAARRLELVALPGLPLVEAGDDLAGLVVAAVRRAGLELRDGDVVVLAQKIVSKAEGRRIYLDTVQPSPRALEVAAACDKDPRLVELVLAESREVRRAVPGVLITVTRHGVVCANAGLDRSNVGPPDPSGREAVLLLPVDPDASARAVRERLGLLTGARIGVVVNDSLGRAWRLGQAGAALGASGLPALLDLRGRNDLFGRTLEVSQQAVADEVAAAASLLQGQAAEGVPVVLVRGLDLGPGDAGGAAGLVREPERDLFR